MTPRLVYRRRMNSVSHVCSQEVTDCFTVASVASHLPSVCFLWGTKVWKYCQPDLWLAMALQIGCYGPPSSQLQSHFSHCGMKIISWCRIICCQPSVAKRWQLASCQYLLQLTFQPGAYMSMITMLKSDVFRQLPVCHVNIEVVNQVVIIRVSITLFFQISLHYCNTQTAGQLLWKICAPVKQVPFG